MFAETEIDLEWEYEEVEEDHDPRPIPQEKYDLVTWSEHEKLFKNRIDLRNKVLATICVPFWAGLQVKMRRSVFGTFLKFFNKRQNQDEFINENKFTITETIIKEFNAEKKLCFEYNNNFLDDTVDCLNKSIKVVDEIDYDYLYEQLKNLRLDDYHINAIDDSLKRFENLQNLVLCGNWLTDIDGSILPRRLKFLELYANEISSLENLLNHLPKSLTHLGLGRNKLTNGSLQPLAVKSPVLKSLKSLDLSDCDIYYLEPVLENIKELPALESLYLEGNPCSMIKSYKDLVLDVFPNLIFLDGFEIKWADRTPNPYFKYDKNAAELVFESLTLSGIPKPPKEKKLKQTFHIEFVLPLFQEDLVEDIPETELLEGVPEFANKKGKKRKKDKKEKKSKKSKSSKSKKSAKGAKASPYSRENEYNPRKKILAFKTDRRPWSNYITFPSVYLKSPEYNLFTYRDTFRTTVHLRVVYMITQDPPKKKDKKGKGKAKGKDKKKKDKKGKNDKKNKKSKKGSKGEKEDMKDEEKQIGKIEKKPEEIIHKRISVINITCDLFKPSWHKNCEFYWSEDSLIGGAKAMEKEKYLQMVEDIKEKERIQKLEEELAKKAKLAEKAKNKKKKNKGKEKGKDKKSKSSKSSRSSKKSKKSKKSSKKSKKGKKSKVDHMVWEFAFGMKRLS